MSQPSKICTMTSTTTTTALVSLLLLCPALAKSPPAPPPLRHAVVPAPAPPPEAKRVNLTELLTLDGPFHTFLKYLQKANLVETFENQAYRTDQGVTLFVPADKAFAAVKPSALSSLSGDQLKSLLLYHSLPKHYALSDFEALSNANPVTTFAGGQYTVNVTYDAGIISLRAKWSRAKIFGSVYATAPFAVYELDAVLLPGGIFTAQPPVAAAPPPSPAAAASPTSSSVAPGPDHEAADAKSSACRMGGAGLVSCAVLALAAGVRMLAL